MFAGQEGKWREEEKDGAKHAYKSIRAAETESSTEIPSFFFAPSSTLPWAVEDDDVSCDHLLRGSFNFVTVFRCSGGSALRFAFEPSTPATRGTPSGRAVLVVCQLDVDLRREWSCGVDDHTFGADQLRQRA